MRRNTMPSLAALLGLLAIAGYQNRDKIGEFLRNAQAQGGAAGGSSIGGMVDSLARNAAGVANSLGVPPNVTEGLKGIVDSFRNAGQGPAADSWVSTGPNQPVTPSQTETALGADLIDALAAQTGLSRDELLSRLAKVLPEAVDKMTPDGRLPQA